MTDSEYIFYIVEHFQTSVGILIEKKSIIEVTIETITTKANNNVVA